MSLKSITININMFKENLFYPLTNKYTLKVNMCRTKLFSIVSTNRITQDLCIQIVVEAMLTKKLQCKLSKSLMKNCAKKIMLILQILQK